MGYGRVEWVFFGEIESSWSLVIAFRKQITFHGQIGDFATPKGLRRVWGSVEMVGDELRYFLARLKGICRIF